MGSAGKVMLVTSVGFSLGGELSRAVSCGPWARLSKKGRPYTGWASHSVLRSPALFSHRVIAANGQGQIHGMGQVLSGSFVDVIFFFKEWKHAGAFPRGLDWCLQPETDKLIRV